MIFLFMGKRWAFRRQRNLQQDGIKTLGLCDDSTVPGKAVTIEDALEGEEELETIVHELLHACGWPFDHDWLTRLAQDLARVLFKLGYRRT